MYFTLEPKSKKEDFFNYEHEYRKLVSALQNERLIFVLGVRRTGKTSLMNVVYNQLRGIKVWLDGRIIRDPKKEIFWAIYEAVKEKKSKIFGKIESLNIEALGIGLTIKVKKESLREIEKEIRKVKRIFVFIDEAAYMPAKELSKVLSYFYDFFPNITFIVSGSEVGLINEIIGEGEIEQHPLHGREISKIILNRLDKNRAYEFLKEGFKQINVKIKEDEIYQVINELDGLIGWLTLFGFRRGILKEKKALKTTIEIASRIAASELNNFLEKVKNRKIYLTILRKVNGNGWLELKNLVDRELRKTINPSTFNYCLNKLKKYSFVEERDNKYFLADPILLKASFLLS